MAGELAHLATSTAVYISFLLRYSSGVSLPGLKSHAFAMLLGDFRAC